MFKNWYKILILLHAWSIDRVGDGCRQTFGQEIRACDDGERAFCVRSLHGRQAQTEGRAGPYFRRGVALSGRLPRLGERAVQAPRRRGLGEGARGCAGPVLQSALPVARCRGAVLSSPPKRLSHRSEARTHRVSLQMRRPRHARSGDSAKGRCAQYGRSARQGLLARSGVEAHCRPWPRRRHRDAWSDLATGG